MVQLSRTAPQPHTTHTPRGGHHACVAGRDGHRTPPTPSGHQWGGGLGEGSEAGEELVGVVRLCPGTVPLELQV